jgi:hypothetical protein
VNLSWRSTTVTLLIVFTPVLGGCSGDRELRTPGQAAGFVVEIAGGESPDSWQLASKPTAEAAQAWADRVRIGDLGHRLRQEGSLWTCEFAHKSIGLGSIGDFNENDSAIETREGASLGVKQDLISATLRDIVALHYRELVLVSTSICGPYKQ